MQGPSARRAPKGGRESAPPVTRTRVTRRPRVDDPLTALHHTRPREGVFVLFWGTIELHVRPSQYHTLVAAEKKGKIHTLKGDG
jgi:hypothetical protein